jgi:peptidoglycan/LPS O-acetylase OafA/YrhL
MSTEHTYQAELDGLRALAVIGVLLCHLEFAWLPGGFVGVDIFFVLSGFLITRLIVTEVQQTGRFRFGNFYVRRIRRLYPALVTTVIAAWIGSFLLLSPAQLQNFAQSAIAALFSYSNVLFYSQADYFDALATTKPLLHTWSLSVEEQFYLLWPLTLLLANRFLGRRGMIAVLAVISVASLALAQYWLTANRTAAFYILPARVIELGLGALVVFLPSVKNRWLLNSTTIFGVVAMLVPMVLYTEATPFPGFSAMLPCLGAVLFIVGARSEAAAPFRLGPVAWIGRISYSLYLVHWPLIVLWRAYFYRPIEALDAVLLGAVAILLAWLQYALIEQRFRRPVPGRNRRVIAALVTIAVVLSAVSVQAAMNNGWRWRVPEERLTKTTNANHSKANCGHFNPDLDRTLVTCQNYRGMAEDLYVWGDSHAAHLAAGLARAYPDRNIYIFYRSGCAPQSGFGGYLARYDSIEATTRCANHNRRVLDYLMAGPARDIVITSAKRATPELIAEITLPVIAALEEKGNTVAFLGDFIRPGVNLVDCVAAPAFVVSDFWVRARCTGEPEVVATDLDYNLKLASLAPSFISPSAIQCPAGVCRFFDGARLLYRDHHHFNDRGSRVFMRELKPLLPF